MEKTHMHTGLSHLGVAVPKNKPQLCFFGFPVLDSCWPGTTSNFQASRDVFMMNFRRMECLATSDWQLFLLFCRKSSEGFPQRFDKCLEDFYSICDQIELNLVCGTCTKSVKHPLWDQNVSSIWQWFTKILWHLRHFLKIDFACNSTKVASWR